jgi:TIR domain
MNAAINFFSYSRTDSEFALQLAKNLREAGAAIWLDQLDIVAGSHWDSSVETALNAASRLIVILSPASVESANVMDEVSYALESGKTVIPIIISKCNVPLRLKRLQRIDFTGNYNNALQQLQKVLEQSSNNSNMQIYNPAFQNKKEGFINNDEKKFWKKNKNSVLSTAGIVLIVIVAWYLQKTGNTHKRETIANTADSIQNATTYFLDTLKKNTISDTTIVPPKNIISVNITPLPLNAKIYFDTSIFYRFTTAWQDTVKSMEVKTANKKFTPVELGSTSDVPAQAWKIIPLSNGYFRLVNKQYGNSNSVDIIEDGDHFATQLAATGYFQGQLWRITPLSMKGYYKLTSWWKGEDMALDVRNDGENNILQLTPFVNTSGQNWLIQPF